jgi:hypothetical protein
MMDRETDICSNILRRERMEVVNWSVGVNRGKQAAEGYDAMDVYNF